MFYGLGSKARRGLGAGVGALAGGIGGLFGGEDKRGFGAGATAGAQKVSDAFTAQANNISVNELVTRRRIREDLATQKDVVDDGSLEARIKLAKRAAKIANETGDAPSLARALDTIKMLESEKAEFDKLQAVKKKAEVDAAKGEVEDAFDKEGNPITGVLGNPEGTLGDVGGRASGLWVSDGQGGTKFMAFGSELTREDPLRNVRDQETIDERMRKLMKSGEPERIKGLVVQGLLAARKYDRVMATLTDLYEQGGVEQVIGASGKVVSFVDNLVRNIKGVAGAFLPSGDRKPNSRNDWSGLDYWRGKAGDGADSIWESIDLPSEFRGTSAAAQQHRANIMELAYMAARLAEPSNRGLSDNDIKNALTRIAGDSSNPQVMMRKFVELMADGARQVDDEVTAWHGSLQDVPDEEIDRFLGGDALPKYRREMSRIYAKYGVTFDDAGRAVYDRVIGTDVQPGTGVLDTQEPEDASSPVDAERRARLEALLPQGSR